MTERARERHREREVKDDSEGSEGQRYVDIQGGGSGRESHRERGEREETE